jgi:hypothetical protein
VTGVTPDAWSGIHSAIASSVAPAPDQRDYMLRIQATFVGQGTGVFSAMRLAPYAFPKKERPLTQPVAKKLRPIGQPRRIARE